MDLEITRAVAQLRDDKRYRIFLEVVIPYAGRLKPEDKLCQEVLSQANGVKTVCDEYSEDYLFLQHRDMILRSDRVIAVIGGQAEKDMMPAINYATTMEGSIPYSV